MERWINGKLKLLYGSIVKWLEDRSPKTEVRKDMAGGFCLVAGSYE
ncbi:MAG: hypothetical protein WCL06_14955 [Bacteroidota bacterium]